MEERNELKAMINEIVEQVSKDATDGIARFLQANPYSSFEYYHFRVLKNNPYLFEKTLYCESEKSMLYKNQICKILEPVHIKIASKIIEKEITAQKMTSSLS